MTTFEDNQGYAERLDEADPLRSFRDQFHLPRQANGEEFIYLVGNSLGLQPKITDEYVGQELRKWQTLGVRGHFESQRPWMPYHEFLAEPMASLIGARPSEVVMMNSLTVNLHLMLTSFYRPDATRYKILIERHAFPSDQYAVTSHLASRGSVSQDALLLAEPNEQGLLDSAQLEELIESHSDSLAVVLLPGVQYYTGQRLDLQRITEMCHKHNIIAGFDLAHAAGNVPLQLHDWDVDFAVWCSYKYLNSGPGSVGGCFVHERHCSDTGLPRLAGWWGHDKESRFAMRSEFSAIPTAEGWQLSNPPILSLAAIRASLEVFSAAGGMAALRAKSCQLTSYLEWLLRERLGRRIRPITPQAFEDRGCQLSIEITDPDVSGKQVREGLEQAGVLTDWREPNVIRAAPVPLYNTYCDVFQFVERLGSCLN